MLKVLGSAWALLFGMMLLMVGNGLQGSLIGIRGAIEDFSTAELSIITSGYFAGFLFGSRITPLLIQKVGHVRVFAALGSFISAVLILYPTITEPWAWIILRVIFGFSFSGVYVTAESWLNNASDNENRGKALSLYVMVQMLGIVLSQALLNVADPAGFVLFVIPSVLVSLSFAPILLTASKSPSFETTKPMSLKEIYKVSPLGFVGMFLLGVIFSAQFGMASIYGTQAGLSVAEISAFVSAIFLGGMLLQFPFGWLSDRMDRRILILSAAIGGGIAGAVGWVLGGYFEVVLVAGFIMGGMSNPLYALIVAYTNDYLDIDDMAAASGGLIFVNGLGAIMGPVVTGWVMGLMGPGGFWAYLGFFMFAMAAYAAYRMTQRPSAYREEEDYESVSYAPISPIATPVAMEAAQEYYAENVDTDESNEGAIDDEP
ncbi:MAG: MFS transporter [Paracoccaceae bacterium]|nr:MFS transporter [Paracoccaceae bacterium]